MPQVDQPARGPAQGVPQDRETVLEDLVQGVAVELQRDHLGLRHRVDAVRVAGEEPEPSHPGPRGGVAENLLPAL